MAMEKDKEQTLRRAADSMLPFLTGLLIGGMSTYASFSGKMSAIDARLSAQAESFVEFKAAQSAALADLRSDIRELKQKPR